MRLGSSMRRRRGSGRGSGSGRRKELLRLAGYSALVVVVGFGIGWLTATRLLFPAPEPPGDLFEVPDVRGEDLPGAADLLDRSGLSLGAVGGLRHPEVDSGVVVGQSPLPGQLSDPNAPVRVTLSLGPERRAVPEIVDLRADRARNLLEATGFAVVVDSVRSEEPKGRVLEVEPEEGTELAVPGEVRVVVSLGPPRFPMPRLVGMTEEEARDTLGALGLEIGEVEEVFRFGRDQGLVVRLVPPAEDTVQRGAAVRLAVGRTSRDIFPSGGADPDTTGGNKAPLRP